MKKKLTILVVSTLAFLLMLGAVTANAGTSFSSASRLPYNVTTTCSITSGGQYQYYYFVPSQSGYYEFWSEGDYDTYGYIYDAYQDEITHNDDGGSSRNFNIREYLTAGNKYYFVARMYSNSVTGSFNIRIYSDSVVGTSISGATVTLSYTTCTYDGYYKKPIPTVTFNGRTLRNGSDYVVNYQDNVNAGTAYAIITGIGNYSGTISQSFRIYRRQITSSNVTLSSTSYTYSGESKRPSVRVSYNGGNAISGSNYTVSYSNNKNAGTAKVTVTGVGNYYGTANKSFKINPKKITKVKLNNYTYTGKAIVPSVHYTKRVYDAEYGSYYDKDCTYKKGTDYTIKVAGNKKAIGEYQATIVFKGNYKGTVKKTYKILPKPVKNVKTSIYSKDEIKVTWIKVDNVTGYRIYRWNTKKGKYTLYKDTKKTSIIIPRSSSNDFSVSFYIRTYKDTGKRTYLNDKSKNYYDYEYVKLSKPKFKIAKDNFNEFTINFNTAWYYECQLSESKSFKETADNRVKTCRYYTDTIRWYNLNSGQKYYMRVRAYYYDKKGNLKVGPWSEVKAITPY